MGRKNIKKKKLRIFSQNFYCYFGTTAKPATIKPYSVVFFSLLSNTNRALHAKIYYFLISLYILYNSLELSVHNMINRTISEIKIQKKNEAVE